MTDEQHESAQTSKNTAFGPTDDTDSDVVDRFESALIEDSESTLEDAKQSDREATTSSDDPATEDHNSKNTQANEASSDGSRLWDSFQDERHAESQSSELLSSVTPDTYTDDQFDSPSGTQQISDQIETVSSGAENATAFSGILERISSQVGSASDFIASKANTSTDRFDTATGEDTATGSTAASRHTQKPDTSTDRQKTTQTDQGSAGLDNTNQQSVTISQLLEHIDLFGRATASTQVLVLSPTTHSVTNDIYRRVLLPSDGTGQNVLFVSAIQSPPDQLPTVQEVPGWTAGKTAVIEVGQSLLRPTEHARGPDQTVQLDSYKQLSNFQNFAKLGVNISHIVSQWNATHRSSIVGVHTLSSIQQYVGNEAMFQFLFTLKGQLNSMGVRGYYHMDPAVHTENEINTIRSAFDISVTVSSDGSIDIQ